MDIALKMSKNFQTQLNKLYGEYGEDFAKLNGLSDRQLNFNDFIDNFIDTDTVADASIDGNANVGHKDIVTMMNEMSKPHQKLLALNKIYYEIQKKYDYQTANEWLTQEWTRGLYMHDCFSSSMIPYCFAYDLKDLAEKGLYFIENFNGAPPKHLTTFVDFVKEHCSFASNRSAGAVAYPNLIPYMFYFWKKDVESGYMGLSEEHGVKFAKQQIQRLIYSLNQPFLRNSIQSA